MSRCSVFRSSLCSQVLSALSFCLCYLFTHTGPLCSSLLSVFLSLHTQVLSGLPFCLCSYLFTHKSSLFYPSGFLSVHTQVLSVLPICLSYPFTHKSSLSYPSVCVLICSHTIHLCFTLLSVFLSVRTQILVLPLCVLNCSRTSHPCSTHLCSYLFTHKSSVLPFCLSVFLSVHTQILVLPLCLSMFFRSLRWTGKERRSSMSHSRHCTTASFCGTGHAPPTLLAFCRRVSALPLQRPPWYVEELGIRCLSDWLHV